MEEVALEGGGDLGIFLLSVVLFHTFKLYINYLPFYRTKINLVQINTENVPL